MNIEPKAFNQYCADVMGYEYHAGEKSLNVGHYEGTCWHVELLFDPFDDANQRHEVFDKLWINRTKFSQDMFVKNLVMGADYAEREFIMSTKEA